MKRKRIKSVTALLIVFYIIVAVGAIHGLHPFVHALGEKEIRFEIGDGGDAVTASLSRKGVLTVSGKGMTRDYTEETAPFLEYADRITSVKIEEGITSIGDCLFYNCESLKGSLVIPSSVIWIGDYAFGGESREKAPKFSAVESRFAEGWIAYPKPGKELESSTAEMGKDESAATPGNASGGPGETGEAETSVPDGNADESQSRPMPEDGAEGESSSQPTSEGGSEGGSSSQPSPDEGAGSGSQSTSAADGEGGSPGASASGGKPEGGSQGTSSAGGSSGSGSQGTTAADEGFGSGSQGTSSADGGSGSGSQGTTAADEGSGSGSQGTTATDEGFGSESQRTSAKAGASHGFTAASGRKNGFLGSFFKLSSEDLPEKDTGRSGEAEAEPESESGTEPTSESEVESKSETKQETKPGSNGTAAPSTPSQAQDTKDETEADEEFSEDGALSNDLYDGAVDASGLDEAALERYTVETITSQIIGMDIFYSGQRGTYQCEEENTAFLEAAEQAGYQKADRFIEVNMEGITESLPVVHGVLYAPELPEAYPEPESAEDSIFENAFQGWYVEDELLAGDNYPMLYTPGTPIAVNEDTQSLNLFGEWGKTCRIAPEIRVSTDKNITTYTVVDGDTGEPIPKSQEYQITYQWQICEPQSKGEDSLSGEENSGMNEADTSDDSSWSDIEGEESAVYMRLSSPEDRSCYFRVRLSIEKSTQLRSAGESVSLFTDPVQGEREVQKITVIYEPGEGGTGTAPEPQQIDDGESIIPITNPFTRATDDGMAFTGWKISYTGTSAAKPSGTAVENGTEIEEGSARLTLTVTSVDTVTPTVTLTAQWSGTTVYYVSTSGSDNESTNDGSKDKPFRTIGKALGKLPAEGKAETNIIELLSNYTLADTTWENKSYRRNFTLRGQGKDVTTLQPPSGQNRVYQQGDVILEKLKWYFSTNGYWACCQYNLTLREGTAMDSRDKYGTADWDMGIPAGTPQVGVLIKHLQNDTASLAYGPHGKNADDPVRVILSDDDIKIGRFATDGWNPEGNNVSSPSNPLYSEVTVNKATIGLMIHGGIADVDVYNHSIFNINGGSIYNFAGGGNVFAIDVISKTIGSFEINMAAGEITTLNAGPMGRRCSNNVYSIGDVNLNISGGKIGTLYAGGSTGRVDGDITTKISGGTIGTFFGGGRGKSEFITDESLYRANAGMITGNVTTVITGGEFAGNVYAGGQGYKGGTGSAIINGNTSLTISGTAKINGSVYGGGIGLPNDLTAAKINGSSTVTISGGTIAGDVYAGGERGSIANKATMNIEPGANIAGNIYGGGNNAGTVGSSCVNLNTSMGSAEAPKDIYGAGKESGTLVSGEASVNISGHAALYGNVYGGGEKGTAGSSAVTLESGSAVTGNVFGGGNQADTTGTVKVDLQTDSKVAGYNETTGRVYGGPNNTGTVSGMITMNVTGSAVNVFGGGEGEGTSAAGGTSITLSPGAAVSANVYGGGNAGSVTNTGIRLNGGSVLGNVFGGGNKAGADSTSVETSSAASVTGNIYGGSNDEGAITGTAAVTVTGNGSGAANIFGGGFGPKTSAAATSVTAASGSQFTGTLYGGGEQGSVTNSKIILKDGSTVLDVFGGGSKADVTSSAVITADIGSGARNLYGGSNTSGTVQGASLTIRGNVAKAYAAGKGDGTITISPSAAVEANGTVTELYGGGEKGLTQGGTTVAVKAQGYAAFVYGGGSEADVENALTPVKTPLVSVEAGGSAGTVYGGGNTSGTVTSPVITVQGTVTNVYGGGNGELTTANSPSITAEQGAVITNLYGGGEEGKTQNGTTITLAGGSKAGKVFGGGNKAGIIGTAAIKTGEDSHVFQIYGGSNDKGAVDQVSVTVNGIVEKPEAAGPDETAAVYGGGLGENTSTGTTAVVIGPTGSVTGEVFGGGAKGPVTKNTSVTLQTPASSGAVTGNVYGGGDTAVVEGTAALEAQKGTTVTGSLYGGGKGAAARVLSGTSVITAANVSGNVFGGGAEGSVGDDSHQASTHVDVLGGRIAGAESGNGNVFGGSDRAKVHGSTAVYIGKRPAGDAGSSLATDTLTIEGTVFGGGNTTDSGDTFDASNPFVLGSAEVIIDATGFEGTALTIGESIFGDGNMCTVEGDRSITVRNYNPAGTLMNTSLQRVDSLLLETSRLELTGTVDSANLVPTIAYSMNRIGTLTMKGGSTLKLQAPVNLVEKLESLDSAGQVITTNATDQTAEALSTDNRIEIQQGVQMELRASEDVTQARYGTVSGYSYLDVYDRNGQKVESGVYVLGGYDPDDKKGGFLYGSGDHADKRIVPSTDKSTWRNWAIGTDMTKKEIMIMSNRPVVGKVVQIESPWPADGSSYKLMENSVSVSTTLADGSKFVLKNPEEMPDTLLEKANTTLGLTISTGGRGWVEPITAGYIKGNSDDPSANGFGGVSLSSMKTLNNTSINPSFQIEMTTRDGISVQDADKEYPLTVEFKMRHVLELSDGSSVDQGILTVILEIRREKADTYADVLLSTGKEYIRADNAYVFDTRLGEAGVTISEESAITLQYAKKQDTVTTGSDDHKLRFSTGDTLNSDGTPVTLPEGVTILAVDRNGSSPVYAHYTVPAGGKSEVLLGEFTVNGTETRYQRTLSYFDPENYLFILDFAGAPGFSQNKLCVTFIPMYQDSATDSKPPKIVFNVSGSPTSYTLKSPAATGETGEGSNYDRESSIPVVFSISGVSGGGVDTTGTEKEMGIRLCLTNRDTGVDIPIPTDWTVTSATGSCRSSGGSITIPLSSGMIQTSGNISIQMKSGTLPPGKYQGKIYMAAAPMSRYPGDLTGETPVYVNFNLTSKQYSIEAAYDETAGRIFPCETVEPRQPLKLSISMKAINGAETENVSRKVTLLKKNGAGVYEIIDFNGLFTDLSGTSQISGWEETGEWSGQLNTSLPEGTYRLRFEVVKGTGDSEEALARDTENFIVTPE